MVSYLSDLMEDSTGAKAAHAVLLCEMEPGSLQREDMDHIDRIHRAHAQNLISNKSTWVKHTDHSGRKPWYCKNYQSVHVLMHMIMSSMENCISIFVLFVWLGRGKWGTLIRNVHIKNKAQKTTR